jgi:formiminoglutamase
VHGALKRYSTWSFGDKVDLFDALCLVDYGDVVDPDGDGGSRFAEALSAFNDGLELAVLLGGDNAATWRAMRAPAGGELASCGLVTLDAHLDLRESVSNRSPVPMSAKRLI